MAASTPTSAATAKKSRGKQEIETLQTTNEDLKNRLSDVQNELQQERGKVRRFNSMLLFILHSISFSFEI